MESLGECPHIDGNMGRWRKFGTVEVCPGREGTFQEYFERRQSSC